MRASLDRVAHAALCDRGTEVVLPLDGEGDRVAQPDRLRWTIDRDFELRLLVLLQPERAAAVARDLDVVDPQPRIRRRGPVECHPAKVIGPVGAVIERRALRSTDCDLDLLVDERRLAIGRVAGLLQPGLEMDRLAGAVDRSVGYDKGLGAFVMLLAVAAVPDA